MRKYTWAAAAALAFVSSAAFATVTGDATNGWFVGKGDVQSAFGWNNETLQEEWNAGEITFHYDTSADYDVVCGWDNPPSSHVQMHHQVTSTVNVGLNGTLAATGRTKNQITGFNVPAPTGSASGNVPLVGDTCAADDVDGNHHTGTVDSVTPLGSNGGGGLYVSWNGEDVLLQAAS